MTKSVIRFKSTTPRHVIFTIQIDTARHTYTQHPSFFSICCSVTVSDRRKSSTKIYNCDIKVYNCDIYVLFPISLIYIGIVWKDVLFAHAALLGLLLLPKDNKLHFKNIVISALALALGTSVPVNNGVVVLVVMLHLLVTGKLSTSPFQRWKIVALLARRIHPLFWWD